MERKPLADEDSLIYYFYILNTRYTVYPDLNSYLHDLLCKSQIFRVLSWLPETTLLLSPRNLAARTFPLWPVKVCCRTLSRFVRSAAVYLQKLFSTTFNYLISFYILWYLPICVSENLSYTILNSSLTLTLRSVRDHTLLAKSLEAPNIEFSCNAPISTKCSITVNH